MATNINSTQLDFNQIKAKLKTYLQQQSEFADYDFEASGLSNVLDVLAYNTHVNGLIANFALNESFMTTAQLRSSVVALAESLGYVPRSRTAPVAYLTLSITNTNSGRSSVATLPARTRFTTTVDGVSYTFQTIEDYTATDDGSGVYRFVTAAGSISIPVYEGTYKTKTFYAGEAQERQIYVIPDAATDTSTLSVRVFTTATGTSFSTYTTLSSAVRITANSTLYSIAETPNGFYELVFSAAEGTGLAPQAGNKIVVTYLSTSGPDANGARVFSAVDTVTMDSQPYTLTVATDVKAAGGAEKESIESIRRNAPVAFGSQQRLVTALDYQSQILNKYSAVEDCIAWGGQDNIPPEYGKTFISMKFVDGVDSDSKAAIKNDIVSNLTTPLAIMSIDTKFVDPVITYVGCQTFFNYNPNQGSEPVNLAQSTVVNTIVQYFEDNLGVFGAVFRRSNLLTLIDDISPAILNSQMNITLERRFTPILNQSINYNLFFPVELAISTTGRTITSSNFTYNGQIAQLTNAFASSNSTKLQITSPEGLVIIDNIGSYNPANGQISLVGFEPAAISGGGPLKIFAIPANQSTLKPIRNYVLELDRGITSARGTLDYGAQRASL